MGNKGRPMVPEFEKSNMIRARALRGRNPEILVRLAREQTETALRHLINIMGDLEQPGAVRVRACELLLERGWGKTPQQIVMTGDGAAALGMAAIPLMERIAGIKAARSGEVIELEASELTEIEAPARKVGEDAI